MGDRLLILHHGKWIVHVTCGRCKGEFRSPTYSGFLWKDGMNNFPCVACRGSGFHVVPAGEDILTGRPIEG